MLFRRGVASFAIVSQLAGCSLVLMDRAPRSDPMSRPVACDSTYAYALGDFGVTAAAIGGVILLASLSGGGEENTPESGGFFDPNIFLGMLGLVTVPLVTIPSGIVGTFAAGRCRRYNSTAPSFQTAPPIVEPSMQLPEPVPAAP